MYIRNFWLGFLAAGIATHAQGSSFLTEIPSQAPLACFPSGPTNLALMFGSVGRRPKQATPEPGGQGILLEKKYTIRLRRPKNPDLLLPEKVFLPQGASLRVLWGWGRGTGGGILISVALGSHSN